MGTMGTIDDELERELRSLGVHEDLGSEDSDATPTNSPTGVSFKPFHAIENASHPSSKTSGFWEDPNMGRYSQMSNCSSCSDSSLSWGEDNFEGEATRQVTLLFEQLDNLLFSDFEQFSSYPVVPLHRNNEDLKSVKKSFKNSSDNSKFNYHLPNSNRNQKETKTGKELLSRKKQRALHWKGHNTSSESYSGSDSGDEVVWETLPRLKKDAKIKSTSNKQKNDSLAQRRQQKNLRKKLSTISELNPHSKKSLSDESLNLSVLKVRPEFRHYSESDGEDCGVLDALDNVEVEHILFASSEAGDRRASESSEIKDFDDNSHPDDAVSDEPNLRGGIYAMGFTAPVGSQVTSPLLLPTPATPPGVPLQPTPIMIEESAYWSSRFPYLRVTGHGINPLQLKYMEELAFAKESTTEGTSGTTETDSSASRDEETSSVEEEGYLARDGNYDSRAGHLCLTGFYLPHSSRPLLSSSDDQPKKNTAHEESHSDVSSSGGSSSGTRKSSRDNRRVWSGSQDPAVLKEQVLLMLFDSVWPQVINIVGGLVHRYSCHLLARVAAHSSAASGANSRIDSSSTVSEMDVWRRLDSASIFSRRSSLQNSFGSSREMSASSKALPRSADPRSNAFRRHRNTSDSRVADIEEEDNFSNHNLGKRFASQLKRSNSSAGRSRLSTAKALMQIQHTPVCSSEANVVSLPSLDIRSLRPLSSVSSLSSLSTTRLSASSRSRGSTLTLDMETNSAAGRREDSGLLKSPGVSFGGSPRWARPFEGPFLPPISTPASPAILAATSAQEVSRNLSPKKRVFGSRSGHRLTRRNSDSMAKLKRRAHSSGIVHAGAENTPSPGSPSNSSHQSTPTKMMTTDVTSSISEKGSFHEKQVGVDSKRNGERSPNENREAPSGDRRTLDGEDSSHLASETQQKGRAPSDKTAQRVTRTKYPAPRDHSYPGKGNKPRDRKRGTENKNLFVNRSKSVINISELTGESNSHTGKLEPNDVSSTPLRSKNGSDARKRRSNSEKQLDRVGVSAHSEFSRESQNGGKIQRQASTSTIFGASTSDTGLFRFGDFYDRAGRDDGGHHLRTSH